MKEQRLVVIASPGLCAGFALAGVAVFEASDGGDAEGQIKRIIEEGSAGVVLIDEPLYRDIAEEFRRDIDQSGQPIVIPVPGPDWTSESTAHAYIVDILRRAIGYRVRLQ